jgi:NADH-quinone oxidoreductase subunit F
MDFEAISATARSNCLYLDGNGWTRVYVAASSENATAAAVSAQFQDWAERHEGKGKVISAGSFGYYDLDPVVVIQKPGRPSIFYGHVTEGVASLLVRDCLDGDNPRPDLALCTMGEGGVDAIPRADELPLFNLQKRIALRNCGLLDPEDIDQYIAGRSGYKGLSKALHMDRADVVKELNTSRLRGRGGAGYSSADKWKTVLDAQGAEKCVVCNAIDGDGRARTARLLLEGDPHSALEGVLIAAYAVGASRCIICVAAGNDVSVERLMRALGQMRANNLLGDNILDSGFACDIEVREVTPSLVAGEETALLRSLEGKQPMPYIRGDYPTAKGFEGKPTLINNIETLANVSAIFERDAEWFSAIGTDTSAGTKVVTLSGDVVHGYTVEVPFGTMLSSLILDIGAGASDGKAIKAVQFGGPTAAYFGLDDLAVPLDYETISASGSIMGSGTINVIAGETCAVEMTEGLMSHVQSQSCGKCVFCREGTLQMSDILKDIAQGEGKAQDIDLLIELGEEMKVGSICGLGRSAANPVLSSIKLFRHDYDVHIKEKRCPMTSKG